MPAKYRLTYFPAKGRAEFIRLIFHAAHVPFTDRRIQPDDWKDLKPKTPQGMLPVLETPDGMFCESGAIARWAARKFGLYGKTDADELLVEAIVSQGIELREKHIIPLMFEKDEEKKEELKKQTIEQVEKVLGFWEKNVVQTPSTERTYSYTVGHQLTAGDLALLDLSESLQRLIQYDMSKFPRLTAVISTVSALPGLKEYLVEREKMTYVI